LCKRFRILVEAWGEGWRLRSGDPMIGESRVIGKPKPLPLINHTWGDGPALSDEKELEQEESRRKIVLLDEVNRSV
jgi:hypothetical protein